MPDPATPTQARWYDYLAWGEVPICDPVFGVVDASNAAPPIAVDGSSSPPPRLFALLRDLVARRPRLS